MRDEDIVAAIESGKTHAEIAAEFGCNERTIRKRLAKMSPAPIIDAPIVRQSRLTNKDGEVLAQWDIRVPERTQEALRASWEALRATLVPLPPQAQVQQALSSRLKNQFVFSDVHIGLLPAETFKSNPEEAEFIITASFENMILRSPKAKSAILVVLGDWFHFDSLLPITPTSHNVLSASMNYSQMVESGIRVLRRLITAALFHHEEVEVVICEGNHDIATSHFLRMMFKALYENEPRIKFIDSDNPFYVQEFGRTFLGYHHGHIKGLKDEKELALMFASQFAKEWGNTERRFIHTGHLHHFVRKKVAGAHLIQHPTLAMLDSFAKRHGYDFEPSAICTTYSYDYGEVGTIIVSPDMLL